MNQNSSDKKQSSGLKALLISFLYKLMELLISFLLYLKYLLLFLVVILWSATFILTGVLLIKFHTTFSKQRATIFIAMGMVPILIIFIYVARHGFNAFSCSTSCSSKKS